MNPDWWENQMFDYVYHDGSSVSLDESWHKELNFIGDEFKKAGWGWCVNGQHWKSNTNVCWSCDM